MTVATVPTALDLQTGDVVELPGDAFQVDVVVDHEAGDNSGLIPAVAELLIDLWRKRHGARKEEV
jgi:hypothetical protein